MKTQTNSTGTGTAMTQNQLGRPGLKVVTDKRLTMREHAFIREYLLDLNGTQSANRAGSSEHSAASIARENLIKPHILAALQDQIKARFELSKSTQTI